MLRLSANISTLFTELPFLDRFAAAADAGFGGVEIQFPYDIPASDLAAARSAAGVTVVLINMPAGRRDRGDLGLACLPDRRGEFRDSVALAAEYCAALQCRQVNCLSGRLDWPGDRDRAWTTLVENVGHAASMLEPHGVRLLVEPLNREDQPHFLLNSLELADALLAAVGHANLALQFDIYHMRANGEDWSEGIASRLDSIGHVQFSDYPGRGTPGTGTIDFAAFFRVMATLPYAGWTGAEYQPAGATSASLGWMAMTSATAIDRGGAAA